MSNICLNSDSYKMGHYKGYMPNTEKVYSYYESRKGAKFEKTVFYGLQYILKEYLEGKVVTKENIDEAERIIDAHLGKGVFNRKGWEYILNKYDGKLPIRIKAVAEGTPVNVGNALITIENLDSNVPWLTNYLETVIMNVWYPSTVATLSYEIKKLLKKYLEATHSNMNGLDFMLHDFGARSAAMPEAAKVGDSAHLLSFKGTDTVLGLTVPMKYYNKKDVAGFSVFATEHSLMTARGEEGEFDVVEHIIKNNPSGILSMVIDSYNYRNCIKTLGTRFKEMILARDGRFVARPDSGDPVEVSLDCVELMAKYFGYTTNDGGYKVLNDKVRVLYGDGINYNSIQAILQNLMDHGWAAENLVFGMGGALLNGTNRDTQRSALKCAAQFYDGAWHEVWKKPLDMSKASKRGRLALIEVSNNGEKSFKTIREDELNNESDNKLVTVFENGKVVKEYSFDEIRETLNSYI